MPRRPFPLLVIGLTAAAAMALAACGGEDAKLLPGETAREITANLDTVQQLSAEGDCVGAESAAQQVGEQIEALEGVDVKLKRALEEGAVRLEEVIASCEESTTEAIAPAEIPSEEPEPDEKEPKEKPEKEKKKEEKPSKGETTPESSPPLPPPAKGEGKGLEEEHGPPPVEEEGSEESSGGVGPGSPAEGGD